MNTGDLTHFLQICGCCSQSENEVLKAHELCLRSSIWLIHSKAYTSHGSAQLPELPLACILGGRLVKISCSAMGHHCIFLI
ncbi:hypothetical protein FKM82_009955 [Ascaphus truei]